MVNRRGYPGLLLEARTKGSVGGPLGGDDLKRHCSSERKLRGLVDDAHAAAPRYASDAAAGERRILDQVVHRQGV